MISKVEQLLAAKGQTSLNIICNYLKTDYNKDRMLGLNWDHTIQVFAESMLAWCSQNTSTALFITSVCVAAQLSFSDRVYVRLVVVLGSILLETLAAGMVRMSKYFKDHDEPGV